MKIAIPVSKNNQIDNHFGHCDFYNIYTISEEKKIVEVEEIKAEKGCGCKSNIASTLAEKNVNVMLAGGIGNGAVNVLNNAGIDVVKNCVGVPDEIIKQYLAGEIEDSGDTCQHHHDDNHQCNH